MQTEAFLEALEVEGRAFADTLDRVAAHEPVPTCPGWVVRDLAHHVGDVHRRITRYVVEARSDRLARGEGGTPPPDDELGVWMRRGVESLVGALRAAPDDLDCYVLYPAASPRRMWSRRMAHEMAVHGVDLAITAGLDRRLDAAFATDGIDEVLTGIARPGHLPVAPRSFTTLVAPLEVGERWTVRIGDPEHYDVRRTTGDADLRLAGPAAALYRLLWNRGDTSEITVDGDAALLAHWRAWQV